MFHHDNNPVHTESEVHSGFFKCCMDESDQPETPSAIFLIILFLLEPLSNIIRVVPYTFVVFWLSVWIDS